MKQSTSAYDIDIKKTPSDMIPLASQHVVLKDFMEHNHCYAENDNQTGYFIFGLRIHPDLWYPVKERLRLQAQIILPKVFDKYTKSHSAPRKVFFFINPLSARSLEWQERAYEDGLFHDLELYVGKKKGFKTDECD